MVKYCLTAVLTLGMLPCVAQVSPEVAKIPADWTRLTASKSEYTVYPATLSGLFAIKSAFDCPLASGKSVGS